MKITITPYELAEALLHMDRQDNPGRLVDVAFDDSREKANRLIKLLSYDALKGSNPLADSIRRKVYPKTDG